MTSPLPPEDTVTAFAVKPGSIVAYKNELHIVRAVLSIDRVVLEHAQSGRAESVMLDHLRAPGSISVPDAKAEPRQPALSAFSKAEVELAKERLGHLNGLIGKENRTRADVTQVAKEMGLSTGSVYRLIKDYELSGSLVGLIPGQRGPKTGARLNRRVEELIQECIAHLHLNDQKYNVDEIYKELEEKCKVEGKEIPHINTLRNRIKKIPRKISYKGRGFPEKAALFDPTPGEFPTPTAALTPVQIDHVQLDMIVVYSDTRQPWGRPWLTLVIDCLTRMIVGFFLSMSRPNATAAGMALTMGMLPKKDYLASLELSGSWPVQGKIRKIHCDNAKEFRGAVLEHACKEQRIDLELRPAGTPRYGAYIERMVGNVNRMLAKKPGATFSSPAKRGTYDSKKKSAYTLREIEVEVADWIVNHYHVHKHGTLGVPPAVAWERAILGTNDTPGGGLPSQISDPEKLIFDFLPQVERVVSPTGLRIDKADYYSEVLNPWINFVEPKSQRKKKFLIKIHPRRRGVVWFLDPTTKQYYDIPEYPPRPESDEAHLLSGEEFSAIKTRIHAEGEALEDKQAKEEYRKRSKAREAEAVKATASARRKAKPGKPRGKAAKPQGDDRSHVEALMLTGRKAEQDLDSLFSGLSDQPILPFNTRS